MLAARRRILGEQAFDLGAQLGVAAAPARRGGPVVRSGRNARPPRRRRRSAPRVRESSHRPPEQAVQPGAGETPVALHRGIRDLQRLGDLGDGEAAEEAEGNDLGLAGMHPRQAIQSLVEGDHIEAPFVEGNQDLIEGHASPFADPLGGPLASGVVDQDLAHRLGGGGEQIAAVGGIGEGVAFEEADDGLVDQCAGLEGMVGTLVGIRPPAMRRSSP